MGPGNEDFVGPEYVDGESGGRRVLVRPWVGIVGSVLAAVVVAIGFANWPSLDFRTSALVILVGGGISSVAMRRPLPPESERRTWRQWLPWLCVGLAVALWELALLLLGNNASWPPLSLLAAPIDTLGSGRFMLALLWIAGGAWLIRRSRR